MHIPHCWKSHVTAQIFQICVLDFQFKKCEIQTQAGYEKIEELINNFDDIWQFHLASDFRIQRYKASVFSSPAYISEQFVKVVVMMNGING